MLEHICYCPVERGVLLVLLMKLNEHTCVSLKRV